MFENIIYIYIYNSRLWNPNVPIPILLGKKSQASTTSGTLSEDGSEPRRAPDGLAPIVIGKFPARGPLFKWSENLDGPIGLLEQPGPRIY